MKKGENIQRDTELVQRMRSGDETAYSDMMDYYYDAIFFTILRIVNNRSDAEDLTVEVFGKVFESINKYSHDYAFSTWLFKVATNHCIDFLRKKRALFVSIDEDKNEPTDAPIHLPFSGPGPEELLINKQTAKKLSETVEKLKPFWAQLIEMRYYKELSYEEIAAQLGVPMGTIKNQLYRAKAKLASLYFNQKI